MWCHGFPTLALQGQVIKNTSASLSPFSLTPLHGFLCLIKQSPDKVLHPLKSTWHLLSAPSLCRSAADTEVFSELLEAPRCLVPGAIPCCNHPPLLCPANYFSSCTIFLGALSLDMEAPFYRLSYPSIFLITPPSAP